MKELDPYKRKGRFIVKPGKITITKNNFTRYALTALKASISTLAIALRPKKRPAGIKYNVAVCAIFKNEAPFFKEWIDYHLIAGVDHFYLYNNNSTDNFREVLEPYISAGTVEVIEWPQMHSQGLAYKDCFDRFRYEVRWIGYIDLDEFVCLRDEAHIGRWLENYRRYPSVAIYWRQFGSGGRLTHDPERLVIEQYTACWDRPSTYTKVFCNTAFDFPSMNGIHLMSAKVYGFSVPPVNEFKKFICYNFHRTTCRGRFTAQINHYWNKSFDLFYHSKIQGTPVSRNYDISAARIGLLVAHENMCTVRDFTIQRYLLQIRIMQQSGLSIEDYIDKLKKSNESDVR